MKSKVAGALVFLVLSFALGGCIIASTVPSTVGNRALVAGVVVDPDGGAVEGLEVRLGGRTTQTRADGTFELEGVPYGTHTLSVLQNGAQLHSEQVAVSKPQVVLEIVLGEHVLRFVALTEWVPDPVRGDWEILTEPEFQLINRDANHELTNAYTSIRQQGTKLVYEWSIHFASEITTAGNQSAGLYLMASKSRPSAGQGTGGYSYLFLQRRGGIAFFKYVDGNSSPVHNENFGGHLAEVGGTHHYRVVIYLQSGLIEIYRDGTFVGSWTDPSPITSGDYVAARTTRLEAVFSGIRFAAVD